MYRPTQLVQNCLIRSFYTHFIDTCFFNDRYRYHLFYIITSSIFLKIFVQVLKICFPVDSTAPVLVSVAPSAVLFLWTALYRYLFLWLEVLYCLAWYLGASGLANCLRQTTGTATSVKTREHLNTVHIINKTSFITDPRSKIYLPKDFFKGFQVLKNHPKIEGLFKVFIFRFSS